MPEVITIIQARTGSTRLPGKVLLPMGRKSALERVIDRVSLSHRHGRIIVATSVALNDDPIQALCGRAGIPCFRGSESDVLDRYYQCARQYGAGIVVRVTADCPFLCPKHFDDVVTRHLASPEADYVSTLGLPRGIPAETLSFSALERSWQLATDKKSREHVVPYVLSRPEVFQSIFLDPRELALRRPDMRLTLDTPKDYQLLKALYEEFDRLGGDPELVDIIRRVDADASFREMAREPVT